MRIGNAAADQVQHDVYGSVILAASLMFFDERLPRKGDASLYDMLEPLGRMALEQALDPMPASGSFAAACACTLIRQPCVRPGPNRLASIARRLGLEESAGSWQRSADGLRETILRRAWNADRNAFVESLDGTAVDASVLLLQRLGLVDAEDPRFIATVDTMGRHLGRGGHMLRYSEADDFGEPSMTFILCTLWYVEALAAIGRHAEARQLFETVLACRNHVGLLSEDLDAATGSLWGNFPRPTPW